MPKMVDGDSNEESSPSEEFSTASSMTGDSNDSGIPPPPAYAARSSIPSERSVGDGADRGFVPAPPSSNTKSGIVARPTGAGGVERPATNQARAGGRKKSIFKKLAINRRTRSGGSSSSGGSILESSLTTTNNNNNNSNIRGGGGKPRKSILKSVADRRASAPVMIGMPPSTTFGMSRLSFASVGVREYPVVIGDNPSVGQGVPLTIGWEPNRERCYDLEDYEVRHKPPPVPIEEMRFTAEERAQIAKNLGYSEVMISRIARRVKFSTLTKKKKIVRTLHLDTMRNSIQRGLTKISDSSRHLLGSKQDSDDDSDGCSREMMF